MATKKKRVKVTKRKHEVKAHLSNFELVKARSSLNLQIFFDREKVGEIEVGRGSLIWMGRSRKKSKRIEWTRFVDMMDDWAYRQ